jgi:hypothetical protein
LISRELFSAFVHMLGSILPVFTAMVQALSARVPGGHFLHFSASVAQSPCGGPGSGAVAPAGGVIVIVAVAVAVVAVAVAVEADGGAEDRESPELLLQAPAREAPTSTTTSFMGGILRQLRGFHGS